MYLVYNIDRIHLLFDGPKKLKKKKICIIRFRGINICNLLQHMIHHNITLLILFVDMQLLQEQTKE
jgi:hypothetical protein